jgi:hypothetical protein
LGRERPSASALTAGKPASAAAIASASGSPRVAMALRPEPRSNLTMLIQSTVAGNASALLKSSTESSFSKKSGLLPVNSASAACSVAGSVARSCV